MFDWKALAIFVTFSLTALPSQSTAVDQRCEDLDQNCHDWISTQASLCQTTEYVRNSCQKSCAVCHGVVPERFDVSRVPAHLQPIAWLIGIWRSEHGGKAKFPTIPVFTYGEQIELSVTDKGTSGLSALNYTAFAWGINDQDELHSEYGFLTIKPGTNTVALTTVMDNGFVTVEQGTVENHVIELRLHNIGRISFSRDLPVHNMIRVWSLLDRNTLQARLDMETLTHGLREHTFIRYDRIYP